MMSADNEYTSHNVAYGTLVYRSGKQIMKCPTESEAEEFIREEQEKDVTGWQDTTD